MSKDVIIEVVSGVAGRSLCINETRVAGNKAWGGGTIVESFNTTKDRVLGALNIELPQWIPCSERLPNEQGKYLATGIKGSVYIAEFSKGVINGKPVSLWCRSGGHYCNVIAWMELPPAYEGRNEDD